jgi:hypothetical protein
MSGNRKSWLLEIWVEPRGLDAIAPTTGDGVFCFYAIKSLASFFHNRQKPGF